jgi:alpha-2-macroglobulin-like protein
MPCESRQQQLFPYLYDVLEPADRRDLEEHLHACPHCQMELQRSRGRTAEIAAAVKQSFPDIEFKTPRPVARAPRPARMPKAPRRPVLLQRWALAAAVVLAVMTASGAGAWSIWYYQGAEGEQAVLRKAAAEAEERKLRSELDAKQAGVKNDIRAIAEQIDLLTREYRKQDQSRLADQKRVRFEIKAPRSIQAGAVNRFDIQVKPVNPEQPVPDVKDIVAQVIDEKTKQVLFTQQVPRDHQLVLPQDLPIKSRDSLSLVLAAKVDGIVDEVREQLTLFMPEYVTHLATDRPMYRPGEVVRFRSLTLDRFSLQPAGEDLNLRFRIIRPDNAEIYRRDVSTQLVAGKDKQPVLGPDDQPLHGIGIGEFALPKDLPGGIYSLTVMELNDRFPPERRSFVVHRWQQPRFNKEAEFTRASYSPGDAVTMRGKVTRLGGANNAGMAGGAGVGPGGMVPGMENFRVNVYVTVNGGNIFNEDRNVEPDGSFSIDFTLPANLTGDTGTAVLRFTDGGDSETLLRNIPIVLRDVNVAFYPEGGDLVQGVPNRVYFQASTGIGRPADIRGRIVERAFSRDKAGREVLGKDMREVARVQTLTDAQEPGINQGLGVFTFTPAADRRYQLVLDVPVGSTKPHNLPVPKKEGVVLHLPQGVVADDMPIEVTSVGKPRELLVGAYCRGKLLDQTPVIAEAGKKNAIVLHPAVNIGGVCRITVFEKQAQGDQSRYVHVAERLIFRKQTAQLHVAIRPHVSSYVPGESVYIDLEAINEQKKIVPAVVMMAVTDASVQKLANEKSARSMPTHFLLTTEIRRPEDLENADALLGEHRHAGTALDLLLGTQGWRRFAEQNPTAVPKSPDDRLRARHFLASSQAVVKIGESEQATRDQVDKQFIGEFTDLQKKLAQKERQEDGPAELVQRYQFARMNLESARQVVLNHEQQERELLGFFAQGAMAVGIGVVLFLAFFLVSTSLYRLAEGKSGYLFLGAGLCLLAGLFMISVLGTFAMIGVNQDMGLFGRRGPLPPMMMKAPMAPGPVQAFEVPMMPDEQRIEIDANRLPAEEMKQPDPAAAADGMQPPGPPPMIAPGGVPGMPLPGVQNDERRLREEGRFAQILFMKLGRQVAVPAPLESGVVREYAHQHKQAPGEVRRDFAETLYWQPALVLRDGLGKVQFDLSDAVTNFRVLVVSHSLDGRLGADAIDIAARLPYQIEPKVPVEISSGDQLIMPIVLSNYSAEKSRAAVKLLKHDNLLLKSQKPSTLQLEPGQSRRQLLRFEPSSAGGEATIRVEGGFAKGTDTIERKFTIVPDGFSAGGAISGKLHGPVAAVHDIDMPREWINGSLTLQVQAYPSILTDLQKGLDALLREPHGCFEQSSSSNYPNVLILNYLQDTKQANPAIEKNARSLLDRGYNQLLAFECTAPDDPKVRRGYEWFGQTAPPHEALTAYGLLEFTDMARVYPVDGAMLKRTQDYLLGQRDGQGGFKRNARAIDQFGRAPQDITNAYIVWALAESGVTREIDRELKALYEQAKTAKDPYFIALAGLGQLNAGRTAESTEILQRLREFQQPIGEVEGARTSITRSAGRDLAIETTALATLAWLRAGRPAEFNDPALRAGGWLLRQRGGTGSFGSTQATILALKALIEFSKASQNTIERGELRVAVQQANGQLLGDAPIVPGTTEPITIKLKEKPGDDANPPIEVFRPGKNEVRVWTAEQTQIPYTLSWSYRTIKPASSDKAPVWLDARLSQPQVKEGETVKLKAVLENRSGEDQGMAVAVLGLPAGLALPEDFAQLKDLARLRDNGTKPGVISAWELQGRELILYWRELKADAKIDLELDLVSRLPGVYGGPASRAYLYYDAEHKHWIEPLRIRIDAGQ